MTEKDLHEAQISFTEKLVEILYDQFNRKLPIFLVATPYSSNTVKNNPFL